jgi:hypothetical protein
MPKRGGRHTESGSTMRSRPPLGHTHDPLAMQKVVGSNPIIRSKNRPLRPVFVADYHLPLGKCDETPREAGNPVPGGYDARRCEADRIRRETASAGVAAGGGGRDVLPILADSLSHAACPDLLHARSVGVESTVELVS